MKRLLCLFLTLMMLVTLCACGDDIDPSKDENKTTTSTTVEGEDTTTSGDSTTGTTTTTSATTTTTTTYVPSGVTIPIGTTTTTTGTTTGSLPTGTTTSASGSTTTTTTTTTKPTESTGPQHYIALPAVGSDIDVTKKKDRIRVSAATAVYGASGDIKVTLTIRNYSAQWITEETDYILYTCYDKNGDVVQEAEKLSIGVIDTKENVERTFSFVVPAETAEVRITKSKIVYWTEWA